jgi:hypothetical protein
VAEEVAEEAEEEVEVVVGEDHTKLMSYFSLAYKQLIVR